MKKLFVLLCVALCLSVSSCSYFSLESKINRIADKIETKGSTFTDEQWDATIDDLEKLVDEYYDNYDSYTREEAKKIDAAIYRASKAIVKAGYKDAVDSIKDMMDELPGTFNEMIDGAKEFLDELKF